MRKWECKVVSLNVKRKFLSGQFDVKAIEEQLNAMGQQGWELISLEGIHNRSATSPVLTLKREI